MTFTLTDGLLLAVLGLSAAGYAAPALAAALEARKATRLARVVAAGGRLAAQIAVELREVPPGATVADLKARLVADAVQRLKSPDLMGQTVAKLGGSDAGLANIVQGELAKLQLVVPPVPAPETATPAQAFVAPAVSMPGPVSPPMAGGGTPAPADLVLPLTPQTPPTPYFPGAGAVARVVPLLLAAHLAVACALPQSKPQAAFEAEAAYVAAARGGAAYVLSPGADPATAATLRRLEREAYAAVVASRDAPADAAKLAVAQRQVEALTAFMAEKGLR